MTEARKHISNGLLIFLGQGLSRGLGVLLLPLLTMVFLPAQFGMSALATTYISIVSVVALIGLDLTYLQAIPGAVKAEADANERVIWALTLVLAVCAALVGSSAWWLWGKQTPESAPWLALGIFSTMVFSVCQSQMKANRDYLKLALALSSGGVVMYVWALFRGFSGHEQAVTLVSGYALGAAAAVLVSRPRIRMPLPKLMPSLPELWRLVRIGLPAAFSAPVFWIISSMDRWLVAQFWGVTEAGIYSVAASISGIGLLFGSVIQTIWLTEASRLNNASAGDCREALAERVKELTFLLALAWLGMMAFSGEIIHIFARPPYDTAIIYLPWLMTAVMVYNLYNVLAAYLILDKTLNKATIIWALSGVFFIALSFLAATTGDATGIAKAQILVYGLMLGWVFLKVRKDAQLKISFGKSLFLITAILVAGAIMGLVQDLNFNLSHFLFRLSVFTAMSALVAWHFSGKFREIASSINT